jgi:hypothetical protein
MFCSPELIFGGTEDIVSLFHVLRSPDSFSAVPRASDPVFMFRAAGLVFGRTEGVSSRFHFLRSRTRYRQYRGRRVPYSRFARPDSFQRYRGRRVPFSCFAFLDSFSVVPRAWCPVLIICAPELIFACTEGVGNRFHVLRSRTRFRRYRRLKVPFSCFALPNSFSTVPRSSCPVFMFCAPQTHFRRYRGVGSRFPNLRARTRFRR